MAFKDLNEVREAYRNCWENIPFRELDLKTVLSVQHGIVERMQPNSWNQHVANYLETSLEAIKSGNISNPATVIQLVRPALDLGLPVQTPKELDTIRDISGTFGYTEMGDSGLGLSFFIKEGLTNPRAPLWEGVPTNDVRDWEEFKKLPRDYQQSGLWLCWVEYRFNDGRKPVGNLEPASPPTPQPRPF